MARPVRNEREERAFMSAQLIAMTASIHRAKGSRPPAPADFMPTRARRRTDAGNAAGLAAARAFAARGFGRIVEGEG